MALVLSVPPGLAHRPVALAFVRGPGSALFFVRAPTEHSKNSSDVLAERQAGPGDPPNRRGAKASRWLFFLVRAGGFTRLRHFAVAGRPHLCLRHPQPSANRQSRACSFGAKRT